MLSCCSYLRLLLKAYTMVNTGKLLHCAAPNNRLLLRRSQDLSLNWRHFNSSFFAVFLRHKKPRATPKLFRWGNYTSVSVNILVFQYANKPAWLSVSVLQWVSVAFESSVQRTQSKISWVHALHANFVYAYTTRKVWTQLQSAVPLARNCYKCQMFRLLWSSLLWWQNDRCTAVKMCGNITISI